MQDLTIDEYKRRVNDFLDAHVDQYTEREINYIRRNIFHPMTKEYIYYSADILRQIYDELGLLPSEKNIYLGFLKLLEDNFDIDRNIVEVAGGRIPCLAKRIAIKQKTGTITVYDPRLIPTIPREENMILKRQSFNTKTPVTGAQLIIGVMPCDATIAAVEAACDNNIDFMFALCEGGDRSGYEWLETDEEWIGYIKYIAGNGVKNNDMGTLHQASLESYGSPYPVIYNKRRK